MARTIVNLVLAVVLAASIVAHWALAGSPRNRNIEFMPDMAYSPAARAFAASTVFSDGATLHLPPAGTIARGHRPLRYGATPADAIRAGEQLQSPFSHDDRAAQVRGRTVFVSFCRPCHGAGGLGDGLVVQRGVPPPPSLLATHARDLRDGQLFHIITFGQGNMPPYASQVPAEDRWAAIAYVRSLQGIR